MQSATVAGGQDGRQVWYHGPAAFRTNLSEELPEICTCTLSSRRMAVLREVEEISAESEVSRDSAPQLWQHPCVSNQGHLYNEGIRHF